MTEEQRQPQAHKDASRLSGGMMSSIKAKMILCNCGIVFIALVMITAFYSKTVTVKAVQRGFETLDNEIATLEPVLENVFDGIRNDVRVLSKVSSIQGLVRSTRNNGIDAQENSNTTLWRHRLETVFTAMIETNPAYVQIRYIGLDDGGREIVRVNKTGLEVTSVRPSDLQQKAQEQYFQDALTLEPGEVRHSYVSFNREHSRVEIPYRPVFRTITPVFDEAGKMFGMIVINATYFDLLAGATKNISIGGDVYIIDMTKDFVFYIERVGNERKNHILHKYSKNLPKGIPVGALMDLSQKVERSNSIAYMDVDDAEYGFHYKKVGYDRNKPDRFFVVASSLPKAEILEYARDLKLQAYFAAFCLLAFSFVLSLLAVSYMRRPVRQMMNALRVYNDNTENMDLPIDEPNEVGELARAFVEFHEKLKASQWKETETLLRLQNVVDNCIDGFITIDKRGIVQLYSKACEDMFGYTQEEVLGNNINLLMPEPYRAEHDGYLRNYQETGKRKIIGIRRELEARRKDGTTFPMDLYVSEADIQGTTYYSGFIRDITKQKAAEEEVLRSNEELERFAYIASHDLQEPLRMVSNFTSLLKDEYADKFDEKAEEYFDFISDGAKRMQSLVTDLLDYSRVGVADSGNTDFDAQEQLNVVLRNLSELIDETSTEIDLVNDMPNLRANPTHFSRLMQNIIGNAIKYRDKDRPPKVIISVEERGEEWLFSIEDNGIGVNEDYLEQIFVIFKRLHNKREYSGTGIGLAVCKTIVTNMGGRIWAESELGKGTTFFFTIPKNTKIRSAA